MISLLEMRVKVGNCLCIALEFVLQRWVVLHCLSVVGLKIPYILIPVMSGVVCSFPGSSCKSVLLDDAEVSVLEWYKSSFMSSVVVAGGAVLSVCVCTASSACSIVMAL